MSLGVRVRGRQSIGWWKTDKSSRLVTAVYIKLTIGHRCPLPDEHARGHADFRTRRGTRELYPRRRELGFTKSDCLRRRAGARELARHAAASPHHTQGADDARWPGVLRAMQGVAFRGGQSSDDVPAER